VGDDHDVVRTRAYVSRSAPATMMVRRLFAIVPSRQWTSGAPFTPSATSGPYPDSAVAADENGVTFKYKDYRIERPGRYKTMTLATDEFIRRFLIHVLPKGFHRIRHYGLLANGDRAANIARARELLAMPLKQPEAAEPAQPGEQSVLPRPCPYCGGRMIIVETFARRCQPKHRPTPAPAAIRVDTS
jgi:hypothetical protein